VYARTYAQILGVALMGGLSLAVAWWFFGAERGRGPRTKREGTESYRSPDPPLAR
jgi:hypothetical protein